MAHPPAPTWDVLGLGAVTVDDLLAVPHYPAADTKLRIRRRDRQCGGQTATALVAVARLGGRAAYAGMLGDDGDSRFVLDNFQREGVDIAPVRQHAGARPIHSTIIVAEDRHTRTIFYDYPGAAGAAAAWPPEETVRAARVLFVDHHGIEGMARAARIARAAGIPVVADLERDDMPGFTSLLERVDHLIVSRNFARERTGADEPALAVPQLWGPERCVVVVTDGEAGCWYRSEEEPDTIRHQPAFPVPTVDTTGCGDVFHGAYALALARGLPPAERLRFASAAAALKATHLGGQAGIPDAAAVAAFLTEHGAG